MCFADFFSESLFPRQVAQIQTRQFGRLVAGTKDFFDKFCSEYETNVRCDLFPSSFDYVFICTDIVKLLLGFKGL